MPIALIQRGSGGLFENRSLPHDGEYLRDFDFEAHDGVGEITLTPDIEQAMKFEDVGEAFVFLKRSPVCRPLRADGRPNRPLMAANWETAMVAVNKEK